jgi:hypothetical protein
MSDTYQEVEKRVIRACERYASEEFHSLRKAAAAEAAPSRVQRDPIGRKPSPAQETALCMWIDSLERLRTRATLKMVEISANQLLRLDWDPKPPSYVLITVGVKYNRVSLFK